MSSAFLPQNPEYGPAHTELMTLIERRVCDDRVGKEVYPYAQDDKSVVAAAIKATGVAMPFFSDPIGWESYDFKQYGPLTLRVNLGACAANARQVIRRESPGLEWTHLLKLSVVHSLGGSNKPWLVVGAVFLYGAKPSLFINYNTGDDDAAPLLASLAKGFGLTSPFGARDEFETSLHGRHAASILKFMQTHFAAPGIVNGSHLQ